VRSSRRPGVGRGREADKQRLFATPQEAVQALVQASEDGGPGETVRDLRARARELLSGDAVQSANALKGFGERLEKGAALEKVDDAKYTLLVGEDRWPSPIRSSRTAGSGGSIPRPASRRS